MRKPRPSGRSPAAFTAWEELPAGTDLLFYEGLHGAVVTEKVNVAQHVDLLIGVVPVLTLEWIQKLHRDRAARGYSTEAVTDTILRRMPDYMRYIIPQFEHTHINFPARADRGYLQPVHRATHPVARRIDPGDPLRRPARHRFRIPAFDAARFVHVARQHHRRARRQRWTWRCS